MTSQLLDSLVDQFASALAMLRGCVAACPDEVWEEHVGELPYWMVAYHTAFYADLYLSPRLSEYGGQPDWAWPNAAGLGRRMEPPFEALPAEEIGAVLERDRVVAYLDATLQKLHRELPAETEASLAGSSGFEWYPITRLSMHLVNIRHVQHHAGQLCAVLRRHGVAVDWVGTVGER